MEATSITIAPINGYFLSLILRIPVHNLIVGGTHGNLRASIFLALLLHLLEILLDLFLVQLLVLAVSFGSLSLCEPLLTSPVFDRLISVGLDLFPI